MTAPDPSTRRRALGHGPATPPVPRGDAAAGAGEAESVHDPATVEGGPTRSCDPSPRRPAHGGAETEAGAEAEAATAAGTPRTERTPPPSGPATAAVPEPRAPEVADQSGAPDTAEPDRAGPESAEPERAESEVEPDEPEPEVAEPGPKVPTPESRPAEPEPEPGAPAVDDGRFTVVLDNFEGPFDLLLQLISRHQLDVTEVALHRVTDDFIAHIRARGPDWDLDHTTEFLVVAATLLDLKAARLVPSAEVEDEADLALLEARDLLFARLLQYRAYKGIAELFEDRLAAEEHRWPRTVGLEPHHADLLPEVVLRIGPEEFARLAVRAMQPRKAPQVYVDHIHAPLVSVQEQAEVVADRLRRLGEATFAQLTEDAPDTLTVVARFLALLELYRERAVGLEQEEALGGLTVRWSGGDGARAAVTDEFDRPPSPEPAERPRQHGR